MRQGQSTLEYILLIGIVAVGLIVMLVYVSRGRQGNLRSQAEQLGTGQYAPGKTTISNRQNKVLVSTASVGSSTTIKHGNMYEKNAELEAKYAQITDGVRSLYHFRQWWEEEVEIEATLGALAVQTGNWAWVPPTDSNSLAFREQQMRDEGDLLATYSDEAKQLADDWKKREIRGDKTSSGSYSKERGEISTHKVTSETLGAF
jgi:hypothetical protein